MSTHMLHAIRTQVMWNRLISVVEEQAQALLRTVDEGLAVDRVADRAADVDIVERGDRVVEAQELRPGDREVVEVDVRVVLERDHVLRQQVERDVDVPVQQQGEAEGDGILHHHGRHIEHHVAERIPEIGVRPQLAEIGEAIELAAALTAGGYQAKVAGAQL